MAAVALRSDGRGGLRRRRDGEAQMVTIRTRLSVR